MKLMTLWILFGIGPSIGLACSCFHGSACNSASNERLEFVGRVTALRDGGNHSVAVDFAVSEVFGKSTGQTTLTVYTHAQSTACGYIFREGVEYFVSTFSDGSRLSTNVCSRTRPAIAAAALIRQQRAIQAGRSPARIFGFIDAEPYPGVSPLSRLEAKPTPSVGVTAVGATGEFHTATNADGSFEFADLPEGTYRLRLQLPKDLFIWWASREFAVSAGKMCEADFVLYPKGDPFAANQ